LEKSAVPFGAVVTPCHASSRDVPVVRRPPVRCTRCHGYINSFCKVDGRNGDWGCVFCSQRNTSDEVYALGDITSCPELVANAVDFETAPMTGLNAASSSEKQAPIVFAIDATLDAAEMEQLKGHLAEVLDSLPGTTSVGFITFGSSVAVYDLGQTRGMAVCDVVVGRHSLEERDMKELLLGSHTHIAPLSSCLAAAKTVVESLRPCAQKSVAMRNRARCFGVGVEVALALMKHEMGADSSRNYGSGMGRPRYRGVGRILTVISGPISMGPGTVPPEIIDGEDHPEYEYAEAQAKRYIEAVTAAAERGGVAVDIIAAGLAAVNVPLFGFLTQRTGGCLLLHETFGPLLQQNIRAAISRVAGHRGTLDVFISPSLAVAQVIGPAGPMRARVTGVSAGNEDDMGPEYARRQFLSSNACEMSSVEFGQGYGFVIAPLTDITSMHVFVQFVMSWSLPDGSRLERVVTKRFDTTSSLAVFMRAVNPNAAGVLLAKRVILQALKEGAAGNKAQAQRLRAATGSRLREIGKHLGQTRETSRGFFTGATYVYDLPKELGPLADALYQLVRGPMLGVIAGHPDERALLQTLFLKAGYDESLLLLAPRLYRQEDDRQFYPVPPVDAAMTPGSLLMLDHGAQMFVWIGSQVDSAAAAPAYTTFIQRMAAKRFPVPEVIVAREGSGDARYMAARLVPLLKDGEAEQEAMMPELRELSPEARMALQQTAFPMDEPSMLQWCRHYFVHPALTEPSHIFCSMAW